MSRRGPLIAREPVPCIITGHERYVASTVVRVHLTRNDSSTLCGLDPKRPARLVVIEEEQTAKADCNRCLARAIRVVKPRPVETAIA